MNKALIRDIFEQYGTYLARLLLNKFCDVLGAFRDACGTDFLKLLDLSIKEQATLLSIAHAEFSRLIKMLASYKLALQSKGSKS